MHTRRTCSTTVLVCKSNFMTEKTLLVHMSVFKISVDRKVENQTQSNYSPIFSQIGTANFQN